MTKFQKLAFLLIFVFAAIIRFWHLSILPPSLNWDEISHGYTAYSISRTGQDQWGSKYPIFNFRAYGDYPTTLNMYLTIPSVQLLGLNAFSIRLPTALLSLFTVVAVFYLALIVFSNTNYALIAAFMYAVSPWTVFTSRAVYQSSVAQFFLITGITLCLWALKKRPHLILPGTILWVLSGYAYHNARIAGLLLFGVFVLIYRFELLTFFKKHRILFLASSLSLLILAIPLALSMINPDASARSRFVFIINDAALNTINNLRNSVPSPLLGRLLYNKVTYFIPQFITNYLVFLNPRPLFFQGSAQYQYNVPGFGIMYAIWLPFYYLGLALAIIKSKKTPLDWFLLSWAIIGLLPAAITTGDFPVLRAMTVLPIPFFFIITGLQRFRHKLLLPLFILVTFIQFTFYWINFTSVYPTKYSQSWQYGYQQAVDYARTNYSSYDQIIFTKKYGEAHEFVLFFWPWDPAKYLSDPSKVWDYHAGWYWVDAFDKFKFINDWEIKDKTKNINTKTLLITSPGNYSPDNAKLINNINFLDNTPAFQVVSYEP